MGLIDVHSHLLPGLDDGCQTVEESLRCAAEMVAAGYSHSFCTPHIWPSLPENTPEKITRATAALQTRLDAANIPLSLIAGGEMNMRPGMSASAGERVVSYAMAGKYVLIDLWSERLPPFFEKTVRWLQGLGLTVILAHPERMRAVQDDPTLADRFAEMGVLLQGNLHCFGDPETADTRRTAEQFLAEDRYFLLGSDLHNLVSLPLRLRGLRRVREAAGEEKMRQLMEENPRRLMP